MPELNEESLQFLDNILNNFRKTLPDSALEIYDGLRAGVVEKVFAGFRRAVQSGAPWIKNEILMILADLAFQKMREAKDKSVMQSLKTISNSASNKVLGKLKI